MSSSLSHGFYKKKTFYNWLMNFQSVDLPIGDLAKDTKRDEDFPKDCVKFSDLRKYYEQKSNNNTQLLQAFDAAFNLYKFDKSE